MDTGCRVVNEWFAARWTASAAMCIAGAVLQRWLCMREEFGSSSSGWGAGASRPFDTDEGYEGEVGQLVERLGSLVGTPVENVRYTRV